MKPWKALLVLLLVCGLVGGGFYLYKDFEYRKIHGRVTEVGLMNFEEEVEKAQDMPVLIYFYEPGETSQQDEAVSAFAWRHAGCVKVLKVNLNLDERPENLLLALAFGVYRTPGFVIAHEDRIVKGTNGAFADKYELERLLAKVTEPGAGSTVRPAGN